MTTVFAYRVDHDRGLAPNPFFGICSLAVCKPKVRRQAGIGDYVLGTSSYERRNMARSGVPGGRAVFIMRVTAITDFERYHDDWPRKRPLMRGARIRRVGDAIYRRDPETSEWLQADSLHSRPGGVLSPADLQTDTGWTDKVLLSDDFTYWGKDAPALPSDLLPFTRKDVREKYHYSEAEKAAFIAWARPRLGEGRVGEPIDWRK